MAITFNNNFKIGIGAPIDSKYLNSLNQPYASTGATNTAISESQRYTGLTVNILGVEYWYKNGVTDSNLVLKTASSTGGTGTITGATNGLTAIDKNITLGGTLTTGTTIIDARVTPIGIVYGADYSSTFIDESLITKRYADTKISGTTNHIPVFGVSGNSIQDTTLTFTGTTLHNSNNLSIEVPNTNSIYIVAPSNASQYNILTLGKPTLGSGTTNNFINVAGLATDINLTICSKGSGNNSYIMLATPTAYFGSNGSNGLGYFCSLRTLRMPQYGKISAYGGSALIPDSPPLSIIGGNGLSYVGFCGSGGTINICAGCAQNITDATSKAGGDIILKTGLGICGGANGNIKMLGLPAKTSEINVLYYDSTLGKISFGLASGGTGSGVITGATNGLTVIGMNIGLGGTLTTPTTIVSGAGNTAGIEYFADYHSGFSDRSLIDKAYADKINEKVSKIITQIGHTFTVGTVVGWSGGTYNKPIADGTYDGEIIGIVTKISGNTFELTQAGYGTGFTGLVGNTTYFLSDVTAGLLTSTEPIIQGHINKAVLIADTTTSGWILPYAGYVVSSGLTGNSTNNGERIVKSISQTGHGFVLNDVIGWSGGTYNKAIADGLYNGEVIGIITKTTGDTFEVTQAGYFSGFTTLSANTTYFLSDATAGLLTTVKPTIPTHIVRSVLITTASDAGWVLPYAGYILISGSTVGDVITGATNGLSVFGKNIGLGGTLTGSTIINDIRVTTKGVEYGGNYGSGFTTHSLVDKGYVDTQISGVTSGITVGIGWSNLTKGSTVAGCGTVVSGGTICNNTFYGVNTGKNITTGEGNVAVGYKALCCNTIGNNNVAIGICALIANIYGNNNVGIGNSILLNNICGYQNNGIGAFALYNNTCGIGNNAIGYTALYSNTTGCYNIGINNGALNTNTIGNYNIALGFNSLYSNICGCDNIALGFNSLYRKTCGVSNISFGNNSMYFNTTGCYNIAIGCDAGKNNITGSSNIFIGSCVGYNETGSNKLYIGNSATCPLIYGDFSAKCAIIHGAFKISGATSLLVAPVVGTTSDSVLVWNSGDKLIKTVVGGSLGDKNNIYSKTIVTGNTLLTTGSTYAILVNSSGSTVTLTLPALPIDGQAFKIKDVANDALTYNITIDRNGNNIDSVANDAIINTDGGAIELMYDITLGSWYILSFIN